MSTEVAERKPQSLKSLLMSDAVKQQLAIALPKHMTAERMARVAMTAMLKTPKLAKCSQESFMQAMLALSSVGLEPDGRLAHLIPFENRRAGTVDCQLIIDYKGLVALAMRSGRVATIHADVVCEHDVFDYDRGEITRHSIDFKKPRGKVYAVYALCKMKDGTEKCEVLSHSDVEVIRARSRSGTSGPWVTDWNEMAKKTAFRRLSKWLELSPEYRDALDVDDDPKISGDVINTSAVAHIGSGSLSGVDALNAALNPPAESPEKPTDTPAEPAPTQWGERLKACETLDELQALRDEAIEAMASEAWEDTKIDQWEAACNAKFQKLSPA